MNNIAISSAGRRVSLINCFKQELSVIDKNAKVYALDAKPELSAAARIADKAFSILKVSESGYISNLLDTCVQNGIKLIIPTIDTELEVLSLHKERFKDNGIDIIVSDSLFVKTCADKRLSSKFFMDRGISVPEIYSKEAYKLPVFIKPINGSSSKDNFLIKEKRNFSKIHFDNENFLFQEYIDATLYDEYTCDAYYNKNGHLKCVIPRKRIEVRGGEVSKGLTKREGLVQLINDKLKYIPGALGCITIQFFTHKTNGLVKGLEINPRFGGGFPLSYLAGGNYPKWILEEYLLGNEVESFDSWEENLLMLRYDSEVLVHNYEV